MSPGRVPGMMPHPRDKGAQAWVTGAGMAVASHAIVLSLWFKVRGETLFLPCLHSSQNGQATGS